ESPAAAGSATTGAWRSRMAAWSRPAGGGPKARPPPPRARRPAHPAAAAPGGAGRRGSAPRRATARSSPRRRAAGGWDWPAGGGGGRGGGGGAAGGGEVAAQAREVLVEAAVGAGRELDLGEERGERLRRALDGAQHVEALDVAGALPDGVERRFAVEARQAPL